MSSAAPAKDAVRTDREPYKGFALMAIAGTWRQGRSLKRIEDVDAYRTGMAHINDIPINDEANSQFGGEKQSGYGRFGGVWALHEFTTEYWITIQERARPYPF